MLVDALDLPVGGLNAPIGKDDAVEAEIAARRHIGGAVIAAIGPVRRAGLVVLQQSLVDPIPDEAAGEDVVLFDHLPIVGEVPGAVAHRVRVFDQHERPVVMRLRVFFEMPVPPVHARVKIGMTLADFFDVALGFVLNRARQIPDLIQW